MNILYLTYGGLDKFSRGGSEISMTFLLKYLSGNYNIYALTSHTDFVTEFRTKKYTEDYSITFNNLHIKSVYGDVKRYKKLMNRALKRQYEIIIFNMNYYTNVFEEFFERIKGLNVNIYIYIHNVEHTDKLLGIELNRNITIVFPSHTFKDEFENLGMCRQMVLYPIVPFYNRSQNINNKKKILFVNPIVSKGVKIVIELAKILPQYNFIVYESWFKTEKLIEKIINKYDNICLKKHSDNIADIYKDIDVLIHPTQKKETFGRIIIEAQACGVPVIASEFAVFKEIAKNTILYVKNYNNIYEWANKIEELMLDEEKHRALIKKGYVNALSVSNEAYKRIEETFL